jgi:hypothetical protein
MDEAFELPVFFNNAELSFPARLLDYGYSHKLEVDIDGTKLLFESDEERNWRALIAYEELNANNKISVDLLKAIASSIEEIIKK